MNSRRTLTRLLVSVAFFPALWLAAQSTNPSNNAARSDLYRYIDGIARTRLEARKQTVAQIRTRAEAERRKAANRQKILQLIGGLPEHLGGFGVKDFGSFSADGFRVEKIAYESLPGFWVTADVYKPAGDGPFPAIVLAPGHGAAGKTENYSWGGNFARNGIVALAYDPIGQGERLQYYDAEKKASFIGNPTGEHGEANVGPMLIGDQIARYMVNDAMRGVDYLLSRKDVDGAHIGAFGCSGGGTMTAYFAALDDRITAAATACYITSFEELLASPQGAQDAEQSIPHFIEQGMDFADWVEAFAPKPYAIVSTRDDMFPFEGARQTHDEAERIYSLYGAGDRLQWITGPGGHGNLGPISPQILAFFTKNLKGSDAESAFTALRVQRREDLQVTPTGQVSTSLGGESVYSINRKRTESVMPPHVALAAKADVSKLQTRLRQDIRRLTGAALQPGAAHPSVTVKTGVQHDEYQIQTISLRSDGDADISGSVAIPKGAGSRRPALLVVGPATEADVDSFAKAGRIVMTLDARPTPAGTESIKSPYLGVFNLISLRAFLVGKTLVGLRIDDAIRAMDWLTARTDVDPSAITIYGNGPLGMVALHAAALDSRIGQIVMENPLASYRMIVDQPVHRNVSEVVVPGVLRRYDTADLMEAIHPRPVVVIAPQDASGMPISEQEFRSALPSVYQSDQKLGSPQRVRFRTRAPGEPLPLD
jgi:cephalosporin-C deacetylase-like acetyl esterase